MGSINSKLVFYFMYYVHRLFLSFDCLIQYYAHLLFSDCPTYILCTLSVLRLSDASGQLTFKVEKSGAVSTSDLDSKDVFIVDTKKAIIVWIGQETSMAERKNAMAYAHVSTCNKMIM